MTNAHRTTFTNSQTYDTLQDRAENLQTDYRMLQYSIALNLVIVPISHGDEVRSVNE